MNQFFIDPSAVEGNRITVTGDNVNHIANVLRLRKGESVQLVEQLSGLTYYADIVSIEPDSVVCEIQDVQSESRELPVAVTIYQGMPKSDKLEFVIQKAVELGAVRIVPVNMKRSVVKIDPSKVEKKCARWNAIAESAASQSKRGVIPEVSVPMSFEDAIADAGKCEAILLPYELASATVSEKDGGSGAPLSDMDRTRSILNELRSHEVKSLGVFIGPEGGFDITEVDRACEAGAHIITLGNRILRTETAPIAILSWITYLFEN